MLYLFYCLQWRLLENVHFASQISVQIVFRNLHHIQVKKMLTVYWNSCFAIFDSQINKGCFYCSKKSYFCASLFFTWRREGNIFCIKKIYLPLFIVLEIIFNWVKGVA